MVKQSPAEALPPEGIRYRLTLLQRVVPLLPAALFVVGAQFLIWVDGGPLGPVLVTALVLWVAAPLLVVVTSAHFGIALTAPAAVVHNLRRRVIPWSDIQAIQIESLLGSRMVVIHEAGGRRTRLRAPITGLLSWDRGFEGKFHAIGRWWLDHRGPDWTPLPPPRAWGDGLSAADGDPFAPPV